MEKQMKNLKVIIALGCASLMFGSCSDNEPEAPVRKVIDFENTGILIGGPSPYGENLYANYDGPKFTKGIIPISEDGDVSFEFGVNLSAWTGVYEFSGGGIALSQWNHRSNRHGDTADWWKSYLNQLSVYNLSSIDGANQGAGAGESNTFAIVYGDDDSAASFKFNDGAECIIENMEVCPTAYIYGVITEGNPFGNHPGKHFREVGGWFKVRAIGYDALGNEVGSVEKYLCDYRNSSTIIDIAQTWQSWTLSGLGKVNKVVFDFDGSDVGDYGLNTPSYLAIDNISVRLN